MGGARTTWPRGRRPACGKVDEQSVQLVYRASHVLQFLLFPAFALRPILALIASRYSSNRYVVLGCAHCYLAQVHRVVEWRAVTRSRSPSSTKNPPVPDTPRVAHAEIGRPTVVAGRSLHLGLDRVMGVSKGGGDGCCGDGGLSTKRDTTDARISTSDAARRRRRPPARKAAWAERRSTGRQAAEAMVI